MIEHEFKFLVDKEIFYDLIKKIRAQDLSLRVFEKHQINFYYDTDSLELNRKNITLRARHNENSFILELKQHNCSKRNYCISTEEQFCLKNLPIAVTFPSLKKVLRVSVNPLFSLQGELVTYRTSIQLTHGIKIDFDKNFYLGICDYEIEIEFEKNEVDTVNQFIIDYNLTNTNKKGKSSRFFTAKEIMIKNVTI